MKENIKNFCCLGEKCPNHCCGAFNGISVKLRPMNGIKFSEIILLPDDVRNIKAMGHEEMIEKAPNGIMVLKTAEDGTCMALKNGRCLIYDARPAICRAYPLYLDMFAGVCAVTECKAFTENITINHCEGAMESLLKVYQYWIDYLNNLFCKKPSAEANIEVSEN